MDKQKLKYWILNIKMPFDSESDDLPSEPPVLIRQNGQDGNE